MEKIKENLKKNLYLYFIGILSLLTIFVWYVVFQESRAGTEIYFLDVGQGDAIFIEAPNGNQVLIDGGPNNKILNSLSQVMPFYDRSIDILIETHPDTDHISGLIEVLKNYKVKIFIEPGTVSETPVYKELENLINNKAVRKIILSGGARIDLGSGAYFDVFLPPPEMNVLNVSPHDGMLVLKFYYGKNSVFLAGDMETKMENYLVNFFPPTELKSDILKVGHHGSKTSTSQLFLGYVSPQYAVISVGEGNKYGHPHEEVLNLLKNFGITILRTDDLGTIKFFTDGENLELHKKYLRE